MPSYRKCDPEVVLRAEDIRSSSPAFDLLVRAEVRIGWVFVRGDRDENGEVKSPAMVDKGWPLQWEAKVNPPKYRVQGVADVTVFLDQDRWDELAELEDARLTPPYEATPALQMDAILFDALFAIVVQVEPGLPLFDRDDAPRPVIKSDEAGRPLIKTRRADFRVEGYGETVERYGRAAASARSLAIVAGRYRTIVNSIIDLSAREPIAPAPAPASASLPYPDPEPDTEDDRCLSIPSDPGTPIPPAPSGKKSRRATKPKAGDAPDAATTRRG